MPKIMFFLDSLSIEGDSARESAIEYIEIAATSNHDITVVTSLNKDKTEYKFKSHKIEVLHPFTKCIAWEALKIAPLLVRQSPQIVHFFEPTNFKAHSPTSAYWVLPQMFQVMSNTFKCFSLLNAQNSVNKKYFNYLNKNFDKVFTRNPKHIKYFERKAPELNAKLTYLPDVSATDITTEEHWVTDKLKNYILVPQAVSQIEEFDKLANCAKHVIDNDPLWNFVFTEGWGNITRLKKNYTLETWRSAGIDKNFVVLEGLSNKQKLAIAENAQFAVLSFFDNCFETVHLAKKINQLSTPVILKKSQAQLDQHLYLHQNCIMVRDSYESLFEKIFVLTAYPSSTAKLQQSSSSDMIPNQRDEVGNLLNRNYSNLTQTYI